MGKLYGLRVKWAAEEWAKARTYPHPIAQAAMRERAVMYVTQAQRQREVGR